MFEEYKTVLRDFYLVQKTALKLTNNMESPGREKLRSECVAVFLKKNSKKDKDFIQSFFDPTNRYEDQVRSIEKFDLNKFRPLVSFLITGSKIRDDASVKLIAWLIDFPTYEDWRISPNLKEIDVEFPEAKEEDNIAPPKEDDLGTISTTANIEEVSVTHQIPEEHSIDGEKSENLVDIAPVVTKDMGIINSKSQFTIRIVVRICVILLLVFGGGAFLYWKDKIDRETITKDEKCMYWNGDTYEAVACNVKTSSAKIPLDTAVLNQLKKINEPDTLTQQSIGKVWYGKVNGKPDFYTADGTHPLDANKRLMPLTDYMLTKYISYHRYQLKMLIWSIGGLLIISVLTLLVFKFFAKRSVAKKA